MKQFLLSLWLVLAAIAVTPFAHAETRTEVREMREPSRRQVGVSHAQIHGPEARRFEHDRVRIGAVAAHAHADRVVTHREQRRVYGIENVPSHRVAGARHDER